MANKELCTVRTSYKFYKEKVDNPLPINDYLKIIYDFFDFVLEQLYNAKEVVLPNRVGSLTITGKKRKPRLLKTDIVGLAPDWKSTKELWGRCEECKAKKQIVFFFNEHSNSIRYKFFWAKKNVLIENKNLYYFKPARQVKRKLAKLIKQGQEYYTR